MSAINYIVCNYCGKSIPDDSLFCQYCGVKLETITNANTEIDVESLYSRGEEYYDSKNYEKAFEYYLKAANRGHISAQYSLGILYFYGHGIEVNYEKAFKCFSEAADKGSGEAQCFLGYLYENGEGVKQDYSKAFEWYSKAAAQGVPEAQFNLGVMFDNGQGVAQNYEKAFKLYSKAADKGVPEAQYNLGLLYENGEGVSKDIEKAKYWYKKAADQGDQDAKNAIERLSNTNDDEAQAFLQMMQSAAQRRGLLYKGQRPEASDYGYTASNPIMTSTIAYNEEYLRRLRTLDGNPFTWARLGSLTLYEVHGVENVIVDEYQLYLHGKKYKTIYICPYGHNGPYAPSGMKLTE